MERGAEPGVPASRPVTAAIRPLTAADAGAVWTLLCEFADYERLSHLVSGGADRLAAHLSGEAWPGVEGFIAEENGVPIGYALYFGVFSSFTTSPLVWLEDLYVRGSRRGLGLGRSLMGAVAQVALARGCQRLEWGVLDWNEPALEFYRRLGATRQDGWKVYQLESEQLRALALGGGVRAGSG